MGQDQIVQFEGSEHHFPADFNQSDIAKALTMAHGKQAVDTTQVHSSFGKTGDFLAGVGAGFANTAVNAYSLLRQIPGADKVLPDPAKLQQAIKDATPDNTPSHVGQFVEHAGEFVIPAGAAARATEGAGLIARMAAQAGTAGTVRAAQGGNAGEVTDSAALGAAGPVVSDIAGAVGSKLANIVRTSPTALKILPDVVGMVSPRAGNALRVASKVAGALKPEVAEATPAVVEQVGGVPLKDLDAMAQRGGFKDYASVPKDYQPSVVNLARVNAENPGGAARVSKSDSTQPVRSGPALAINSQGSQAAQIPASTAIRLGPQTLEHDASFVRAVPAEYPTKILPGIPVPPASITDPARLLSPSTTIELGPQTLEHDASFVRAIPGQYPTKIMPGMPLEGPNLLTEPKSEMEDLIERSINGEKVTAQAKAELNEHLKMEALQKTASIIDKNQTTRALKLRRFIQDNGFTPEHVERMTPDEWTQVGSVAEVENPSGTTIQKTKDLLNMGKSIQ